METLILMFGALILGMRHGMDPDHLVVVDGMVRANAKHATLARSIGLLFALGHGGIVTAAAIAIASATSRYAPPTWLGLLGTATSAFFLILLAGINLRAVLQTNEPFLLHGIKGRFFRFTRHLSHPLAIVGVGAIFAISFDTLTQAALFSFVATDVVGWQTPALMGLVFTTGMIATDSLNGLWCSHLVTCAARTGDIASRITGLIICALSVMVATIGITEALPAFGSIRGQLSNLIVGTMIIIILSIGVKLAIVLSRRRPAAGR